MKHRQANVGGQVIGPRKRSVLLRASSLAMVVGGLILIASLFLDHSTGGGAKDGGNLGAPGAGAREEHREVRAGTADGGPEDETLTVTIPKMGRVKEATVPDAAGDDERALRENAAIHLQGTGFPWQNGANVYLAGHVLGYPGTDSFLAFRDQRELEKGDEIHVTDSEGRRYTYRVFEEFVVGPADVWVTEPVDGKSVLTLQTCTLPTYDDRLITRADLVEAS